jgi:antagonist of KipI
MGYALQGPALKRQTSDELISTGVIFGTMQLLPGGQIIILMADHQTTGGYPRVGFIAVSDLPRLAQQLPGEKLHFGLVSLEDAQRHVLQLQEEQSKMRSSCFDNLITYYATHGCQL